MKKEGAQIFVELKYFPLAMHKHARRAAVVAQCALLQGKFWSMQDTLFRTQEVWSIVEDPADYFLSLARGIGLDDKLMMRCMSDKATEAVIDADVAEGKLLGVAATPTFFVNGKMAVGGPNFQAALKEALK
jgi:protein-disulfide isomerase